MSHGDYKDFFRGACDGDLTVGQVLDALGTLLERDGLRAEYAAEVRDLVRTGFLSPCL